MTNAQEIKSRLISLVLTLCVLVLALFVFPTSKAWFTQNKSTEVEGIGVTVELPDAVESAFYYRGTGMGVTIDNAGGKHNQYHFSYNPEVLSTQTTVTGTDAEGNPIYAPERDSFLKPVPLLAYSDLAGECQLLIEIHLPEAGTYTLFTDTETTSYLGDTIKEKSDVLDRMIAAGMPASAEDENAVKITTTNLPMSSIVHFAILTSEGVVDDSENSRFIADGDAIKENAMRYITVTEQDGATTTDFFTPEQATITVTEDDLHVFIFIDYYLPAVEHINALVTDYVAKCEAYAKLKSEVYDDIVIGESTMKFIPDFKLRVLKEKGEAQ